MTSCVMMVLKLVYLHAQCLEFLHMAMRLKQSSQLFVFISTNSLSLLITEQIVHQNKPTCLNGTGLLGKREDPSLCNSKLWALIHEQCKFGCSRTNLETCSYKCATKFLELAP